MAKALVIVDMQMLMQHRMESGIDHVNSDAPARIVELASAFRNNGWAVVHVRHRDEDPASPLHPQAAGYPPMLCGQAIAGEAVFLQSTSSGFA